MNYITANAWIPLEKARKLPRSQPVLPEIDRELLEHLSRFPDEAPSADLYRRSPREHELRDVRPTRYPTDPDHRNTDCPRDLKNRPQGYRLYRRPRQAAAQENLASTRVHDEPWDGVYERQRVGPGRFGR